MPCLRIKNGWLCGPTILWVHYAGTDYEIAIVPYCGLDVRRGNTNLLR